MKIKRKPSTAIPATQMSAEKQKILLDALEARTSKQVSPTVEEQITNIELALVEIYEVILND